MSNQTFPTFAAARLESRAPFFGTTIQAGDSGAEYRIQHRTSVGYRYKMTIQCRTGLSEHTQLLGFFEAHGGATESFLFTDPMDSATRRVRFDQDELDVTVEPGLYTFAVELVTVVVP
jgi:phage-related protein